jgi:hypothetical protein
MAKPAVCEVAFWYSIAAGGDGNASTPTPVYDTVFFEMRTPPKRVYTVAPPSSGEGYDVFGKRYCP